MHELLRHWGALAADALFTWLGVGAYYFVLSLGVLDFQLLRRREIDLPALRMLGWLASLAGVTTIAAIGLPVALARPGHRLGRLSRRARQVAGR